MIVLKAILQGKPTALPIPPWGWGLRCQTGTSRDNAGPAVGQVAALGQVRLAIDWPRWPPAVWTGGVPGDISHDVH